MIKANKPVASQIEKPTIAKGNNWDFKDGFLAIPLINEPNTTPIPTAAPPKPIAAHPAPINLPASIILKKKVYYCILKYKNVYILIKYKIRFQ